MRCRFILALGLALLTGVDSLAAQVNIEALRRDDPPAGISGSVGGTLAVRTGNVDLVQLGIRGRIQRVRGIVTTMLAGDGGVGLLGGSRFSSSGLLHLRQTRRHNEWFSPEWYAQLNYDKAQLLNFRTVVGGGARVAVSEGEWGRVSAGSGLMLEHERLSLPDTALHARRTTAFRTSTFVTVRAAAGEQLVVTSTSYIQPELGNAGDVRILENFALSTQITEAWALTVSFDLRYDSRPPDGIAAVDSHLRTGVTLTY